MTKAELNRLKYRTISFKDIITGGWAHRFQADLNFRLGPTLVGPRESERSDDELYKDSFLDSISTQLTH